jgi:exopolysaccharide biosynthesis protein
VCINGGGFANGLANGSDIPVGYVIDDGEVVWAPEGNIDQTRGNIIGLTEDGKLKLMNNATGIEAIEAGIKYGLEFGPFLIVNGKSMEIVGMPFGVANKCVIAQRKDGVIMFLITEGETYIDGASLKDVVETLEKYGAYNAANLDGGQSTSLVINNQLVNSPNYLAKKQGGRYVVTGFGLIP